jgi:predicted fused transcriptional regulator/phosphomethylpyrimidine kinase
MVSNNSSDSKLSQEKLRVLTQIREIYDFIRIKKFRLLIPEVRTNIAGALKDAKVREEVAGVDGRITIVNGFPKAAGEIKFGATEHTARLILSAKKFDNSVNFVINLKYAPELIENMHKKTDLTLKEVDREKEPEELKTKEFSTMQWIIKESLDKNGKIPDVIWDKGSIGKEPMIRLFGKTSTDLIEKLEKIINLINFD